MNKLLVLMLGIILMTGIVSASLGCFKPSQNFQIVTALNSSSVNITEITNPDSEIVVRNVLMTKVGNSFNYTYNDSKLGQYNYGYCDYEGNCYANSFEITPNGRCGNASNIVFIIFVIILIYTISFIGFFSKNVPITILGGMTMIFLGIYIINNGIIIYQDDLTKYVAYITSFIGAVIAIWAGIEYIQENM